MAFSGKHPRRYQQRTGKLSPLWILLICAGSAILLAILIGNILKFTLDEEAYARLQKKEEETTPPPQYNVYLPDIQAVPLLFEAPPSTLPEATAVSISMNTPDGTLAYHSPVTEFYGLENVGNSLLSDRLSTVSASIPYVSGVFYPQAFKESAADRFYAAASQDAALLREFCHAGGSEILLVDLPLSGENSTRVLSYLSVIKAALADTALGVAVPLEIATSGSSWELLPQLLKSADFLALDMQRTYVPEGASDLIKTATYFLQQYDMRLLLSEANVNLLALPELQRILNRQIITPPPATEPDPLDPTPPPTTEEESTVPPSEDQTENGAYG